MTALAAVDSEPMRLDDAVTWYLGSWPYEGPRVPTADTVRGYSIQLKWFVGFAARMDHFLVADLNADLLRAAIKAILEERPDRSKLYKGGEATARCMASAVRNLARWLRAQGLHVAELDHIKSPRMPERIQPRLRPEEFRKLEDAVLRQMLEPNRHFPEVIVARNLALLYLLADTGLRASEVCALRVQDIDFEAGRVTIRQGKGRKPRALSIVDPTDPSGLGETLRLLARWIKVREEIPHTDQHEALFVSVRGWGFSREELGRLLNRICHDAGLEGNRPPHSFRRATFTERYRANPDGIKVLAARMGWSPRSHHMISVYTRGAELEFASEVDLPSMASIWHSDERIARLSSQQPRPQRPKPQAPQRRRAPQTTGALLDAVRSDPELRKELLQALLGGEM